MKKYSSTLLVCFILLATSLLMGSYRPWGSPSFNLKTVHIGGTQSVSDSAITTVDIEDRLEVMGWVSTTYFDDYGTKHLSLYNSSSTTAVYYSLSEDGGSVMSTALTSCGVLRPGQGKGFDFTGDKVYLECASGTGPVDIDWEATL